MQTKIFNYPWYKDYKIRKFHFLILYEWVVFWLPSLLYRRNSVLFLKNFIIFLIMRGVLAFSRTNLNGPPPALDNTSPATLTERGGMRHRVMPPVILSV